MHKIKDGPGRGMKRRKRYGNSFGVAFCLPGHTWTERSVAFYIMSYTDPDWDTVVGVAIAIAKERFEVLGKQATGVATTWSANFIVPELEDQVQDRSAVYL